MKDEFIVLDRDGVIIKDKHYMHKIKDIEFLPGAVEGLKKLQDAGYKFIIITNQAGIARGYYTERQAQLFNNKVVEGLKNNRIKIEKTYMCPHHPEFTGECNCRKPKIAMAERAAQEFGFDLKKTIFIGDKDTDTEFGKNCGAKTVLVKNNQYQILIKADYIVNNLKEIINII